MVGLYFQGRAFATLPTRSIAIALAVMAAARASVGRFELEFGIRSTSPTMVLNTVRAAKRTCCPRVLPQIAGQMTAVALPAGAGNPAISWCRRAPAETGGFASPPRGGFALAPKLCVMSARRNCLDGQTYVVGDSVRAWRRCRESDGGGIGCATIRRSAGWWK